jgi:hypothetical protein
MNVNCPSGHSPNPGVDREEEGGVGGLREAGGVGRPG